MQKNSQELYGGLTFEYPKMPGKAKMLGYGTVAKKQKWKRNPLPAENDEEFELLPIEEQDAFAFEEDRRCTEGYWFLNNGEPTYITGPHYHYINWFMIDSGYPDYRDKDRRWFYHWELCKADKECMGQMYGKNRRDGYSYRVVSIMLNKARKTFKANYGMVSKTGDDAQEMFQKLVHGFLEYPAFFKPQVKTAEDVKKELAFQTPQKRVSHKNRRIKKEVSLGTRIGWKATKENSYDSMKLDILAGDEIGKFPKDVSLEKWFSIAKTCLILGRRIIGKALFGSTVNEMENGGEAFLNLWNLSDVNKKSDNGRTTSGLWRYFVPAQDGLEGFIDEYGMSVTETPEKPIMGIDGEWIDKGAEEWLLAELKAKKDAGDMVGFYEFKRQFPMEESWMFITPANEKSCWDIEKIYQQMENNKIVNIEQTLNCGYFSWRGGHRDCGIVMWNALPYDDPRVRFRFSWFPDMKDRNNIIVKGGKRAPGNQHVGLFSLDPYAAVNAVGGRGSKAACHAFLKFDAMKEMNESNIFVGEYWNRPKDPLMVYEDLLMACVYFGWALLPERNIKNCNDYFRNRDYHHYLLQPPKLSKEEFIKDINKVEDAGIANTGGQTQQQMVEYLASYIANNVGVNPTTGDMGYMPFNDTLQDFLDFDIDKWKIYDLTVSAMVAVIGSRAISTIKRESKMSMKYFKKYNNTGLTGKKI